MIKIVANQPEWLLRIAAIHCQACKDGAGMCLFTALIVAIVINHFFGIVEILYAGERFVHYGDLALSLALLYYNIVVIYVCAIRNQHYKKDQSDD